MTASTKPEAAADRLAAATTTAEHAAAEIAAQFKGQRKDDTLHDDLALLRIRRFG